MSAKDVLGLIKAHDVKYVDLRFCDTHGKEQHVSVPSHTVDEQMLSEGKMFDGSSIAGWQEINESDMILLPDTSTAFMDPFFDEPTLNLRCDVVDPDTKVGYIKDPRSLAKRAEAYLQTTGIADVCYVGPEPEFFLFDSVHWNINMQCANYQIDAEEAAWNSDRKYESGNTGHRPGVKGGYFPVPPVDSAQDIRSAMCTLLENIGIPTEAHHHEVATAGQNELATRFNTLTKKADETLMLKYVVHNVAHNYGKTATFMPKPLVGDNGSGMHCHLSLSKNGENIFNGDQYSGLSIEALYFIGGIIKHARALNAFTNPATNSYKRLVPGYEAPVMLAYSARNRSAAIRIPYVTSPKARRVEIRFPDPMANPYLAYSALMMAGLDGIRHKMHPGEAMDKNLYDLSSEAAKHIPSVCGSLEQALESLDKDREFLLEGNVFSHTLIDSYIALKTKEVDRLRMTTHPIEFELYYSL